MQCYIVRILTNSRNERFSGLAMFLTEVRNVMEHRRGLKFLTQKYEYTFRLSFELSANCISWISVFWGGGNFSEKFYVQEKQLRR
jgi:hypothetical protein